MKRFNWPHTEETKKRISDKLKWRVVYFSEEHKRKISEAKKWKSNGREWIKLTDEHKEKIRIANTWRKMKPEQIEKMRESLKWKIPRNKWLKTWSARNSWKTWLQVAWNKWKEAYWVKWEKSHTWKWGITPINKIDRNKIEQKQWRIDVFTRDWYVCQMPWCLHEEKYIEAHHIKKFSKCVEKRTNIHNGITLCKRCHNMTKWKEEEYEDIFISILTAPWGYNQWLYT